MKDIIRLLRLFKPYRHWMLLGALAALVTLIANVVLLAVSGWFITAMAVAGSAGVAMNYFTPAALIRGGSILRTVGRYAERLITHEATLRLLAQLRVWFYSHLEPLAPAVLQRYHSGDLQSRIRADVDALDTLYVRVLVPVLVATLGACLLLGFLLLYDWRIAVVSLGFLLLAGVAVPLWSRALGQAPGERIARTEAELRTACVDGLQGLAELQVYGAAAAQARHIDALSRTLATEQVRLAGYSGINQGAVGLCANLSLWTLLWLAIPLVADGRLAPPQLAMLALFTLASFEAVAPLPLAFQQLGRTLAAARRLFAIVDARPAVEEPAGPSPRPDRFDLHIADLGFSYPGVATPALDGLSLDVPQGGRVAIVGASGSGKTTLFNLLLRFWTPDRGTIRLGGHDLAQYRGDDLRRYVTLVSQHTHLFDLSIRDNLLIAAPDASPARLEQACRVAQIHDFIAGLPEGYDTWAGETGVRLSGGQARRIAIARALLRDAPVLLLDEPTEGLDGETEQALMESLGRLMAGRTVILITHRPVGLDWADQVLVMDQGRVLARGDASVIAGATGAELLGGTG
ncbi:thiol reductant ABC exporter subunit CydC [uncultured Lamprocystis sp.]|jgi:ATP-binding cassette subfamily C protein CydC|uniref:thiol reductant ABC exporter subunit CydC n=1 Tax=uncultured Lamprocystis sp. TaxID=543132 RepID=UPI0025FAD8C8|nr:thiol reductant ABC exporter subunit CydC [uncultured Lamprocystis sp.]